MFIKKDLRKIPRILQEAPECPSPSSVDKETKDHQDQDQEHHHHRDKKRLKSEKPLQELRLGRRHQEFQGSLKILCQPEYIPKLQDLTSLNLYDCGISNIHDIGVLADCPNLELLNLGRNPLRELSENLGQLAPSLKHVWLDDCQLEGKLPAPLLELQNLKTLRMPNNQITDITGISKLVKLQLLCLDRNQLTTLPNDELGALTNLKELYLRHNQLTTLPSACWRNLLQLQVLHLSSNQLINIDHVAECPALTHIYANGNQVDSISELALRLLDDASQQQRHRRRLVLCHNPIAIVPHIFWNMTNCEITWKPNPKLFEMAPNTEEPQPREDVEMTAE